LKKLALTPNLLPGKLLLIVKNFVKNLPIA